MSNASPSIFSLLQIANTWTKAQIFNAEISVNGFAQVSQRIAKAWVKFSAAGGTVVIGDSFNVSSVSRSGVGVFAVNFTANMGNAEYAPQIMANNGDGVVYGGASVSASISALNFTILKAFNLAPLDCSFNSVTVHGD